VAGQRHDSSTSDMDAKIRVMGRVL